jgi:phosphoglycolate phosphatase-like HAD superfamily hydrolase
MVGAVSFDADGTLWDFDRVMRRALQITLAELHGPPPR